MYSANHVLFGLGTTCQSLLSSDRWYTIENVDHLVYTGFPHPLNYLSSIGPMYCVETDIELKSINPRQLVGH